MQGRRQICILCQNIGRPARITPLGRRGASRSRTVEPYDASNLVLDLDADDSKYVRKHTEDLIESKPDVRLSSRNARDELKAQMKQKLSSHTRPNPKDVPDHYRPLPIDYLTYALLFDTPDFTRNANANYNFWRKKVLPNCLPRGVGAFQDHIKWLRAFEALPYRVDQCISHPAKEKILGEILLQVNILGLHNELSRLTHLFTRTVEGCRTVASCAVQFLEEMRFKHSLTPRSIYKARKRKLKYINVVVQRLEAMGVDPGWRWYGHGLYVAATLSNLSAMKKYIDISVARGFDFSGYRLILGGTLDHIIKNDVQEDGGMNDDLLKLLTGWDNPSTPGIDEIRKPCLALLLESDQQSYEVYIRLLTKLDAHSALSCEENNRGLPVPVGTADGNDAALSKGVEDSFFASDSLKDPLQLMKTIHEHLQRRKDDKEAGSGNAPGPSLSDARPQTNVGDHGSRSSRDEKLSVADPTPSIVHYTSAPAKILSISKIGQNKVTKLRTALVNKYLKDDKFPVVKKEELYKDLETLGIHTSKNASGLVSVLSSYWTPGLAKSAHSWLETEQPDLDELRSAAQKINQRVMDCGPNPDFKQHMSRWYLPGALTQLRYLQNQLREAIRKKEEALGLKPIRLESSVEKTASSEEAGLKRENDTAIEEAAAADHDEEAGETAEGGC